MRNPRSGMTYERATAMGTFRCVAVAAVIAAAGCGDAPTALPPEGAIDLAAPWIKVDAGAVGLDGNALFVAGSLAADVERMRSLLVVKDGRLAYERYYGGAGPDSLADVRSVTKSIVGSLTGIAFARGAIESLDQPITDFLHGPEFDVRLEHAQVTVGDLLSMSGGFEWAENGAVGYDDWIASEDHVNYLLERPFADAPGETFTYNSAAVHALGVLVEQAVGRPLPDFADEALLGPLGISDRTWEGLGSGYVNGGSGLDLRPRDLARIGQLYLQEGWSGERGIIPPAWIEQATTGRWSDLGSTGPIRTLSYGYLWWRDLDHDAYFAWGYGGQFLYVVPRHRLVVVATTEWAGVSGDIGSSALQSRVLGIIVDRVLPSVR
jgi:CubicO group peptidase (beta-lactamase class C family)